MKNNGTIHITVWTIGEEYPVAFHIQLIAGNCEYRLLYNSEFLGYYSKNNMPHTVRNIISESIDDFAYISI
jgi:hypothetical protein